MIPDRNDDTMLDPIIDAILAQSVPDGPPDELRRQVLALTVALIDRLAVRIREKLGLSWEKLPLAKVLEGGTWSAGRRIARELRPDGSPPI